jgi:hypothetical protein
MRPFPIRESRPQWVSGWERWRFARFPHDPHLPDSENVIPLPLLATVVQDKWRLEGAMILRAFFLHYRKVREAITLLVTIGTAALLSYLILWLRL